MLVFYLGKGIVVAARSWLPPHLYRIWAVNDSPPFVQLSLDATLDIGHDEIATFGNRGKYGLQKRLAFARIQAVVDELL